MTKRFVESTISYRIVAKKINLVDITAVRVRNFSSKLFYLPVDGFKGYRNLVSVPGKVYDSKRAVLILHSG